MAHQLDESVSVDNLVLAAKVYTLSAVKLLRKDMNKSS